mmetsp:Transcript_26936/g.40768  ORF Transcript_26936/g.40768 Transcript_26936/m.40768 type:complete len:319 (-) Transcript_26936:33-989(-)
MFFEFIFISCTILLRLAGVVNATYSIVSTDSTTRQVGGAGATCLPDRDVFEGLYLSIPNRTVLHTQGLLIARDDPLVLNALDMMQQNKNESLSDIISALLESDNALFSPFQGEVYEGPDLRQYGIADFGSHMAHTGSKLTELYEVMFPGANNEEKDEGGKFNNDQNGKVRYNFHAMGNIVKVGTVDSLARGFQSETNDEYGVCDMAGRLMAAMEMVSDGAYGDTRCLGDQGHSATGAFLHIDSPDGTELIHINIVGDGLEEPVEKLKEAFMEWRKSHRCGNDKDGPGEGNGDGASTASNWPSFLSITVVLFGVLSLLM